MNLSDTEKRLYGLDQTHLVNMGAHALHRDTFTAFQRLQERAKLDGFDMSIVSAYRSFEKQLAIWNAKASGERSVLDDKGRELNLSNMGDAERVRALMQWSAIPGASRHHWGTDVDIYDASAVPTDYSVKLLASEVEGIGPFAPMHNWLDEQIVTGEAFGFVRPYTGVGCRIQPERWHITHFTLSQRFERAMNPERFKQFLMQEPRLLLRDAILDEFDVLFSEYITVDADCYYQQISGV